MRTVTRIIYEIPSSIKIHGQTENWLFHNRKEHQMPTMRPRQIRHQGACKVNSEPRWGSKGDTGSRRQGTHAKLQGMLFHGPIWSEQDFERSVISHTIKMDLGMNPIYSQKQFKSPSYDAKNGSILQGFEPKQHAFCHIWRLDSMKWF